MEIRLLSTVKLCQTGDQLYKKCWSRQKKTYVNSENQNASLQKATAATYINWEFFRIGGYDITEVSKRQCGWYTWALCWWRRRLVRLHTLKQNSNIIYTLISGTLLFTEGSKDGLVIVNWWVLFRDGSPEGFYKVSLAWVSCHRFVDRQTEQQLHAPPTSPWRKSSSSTGRNFFLPLGSSSVTRLKSPLPFRPPNSPP